MLHVHMHRRADRRDGRNSDVDSLNIFILKATFSHYFDYQRCTRVSHSPWDNMNGINAMYITNYAFRQALQGKTYPFE